MTETTDPGRDLTARVARIETQLAAAIGVIRKLQAAAKPAEVDALREQDRRLLVTRIAMAMIPAIPALIAAWMASRGVAVDPEAIRAIVDAAQAGS